MEHRPLDEVRRQFLNKKINYFKEKFKVFEKLVDINILKVMLFSRVVIVESIQSRYICVFYSTIRKLLFFLSAEIP